MIDNDYFINAEMIKSSREIVILFVFSLYQDIKFIFISKLVNLENVFMYLLISNFLFVKFIMDFIIKCDKIKKVI